MPKWPLFNRARVFGLTMAWEKNIKHIEPARGESGYIVPINIDLAYDTIPRSLPELEKAVFGTNIKPPFQNTFFEMALPGANACALSFGDKGSVSILLGLEWAQEIKKNKRRPLRLIGWADIDLVELSSRQGPFKDKPLYIDEDVLGSEKSELAPTVLYLVIWSWLLASCSNVELAETHPAKRKPERTKDPSRIMFRNLVIQNSAKGSTTSRREDRRGTALHHRRGHFADYTKGAGLFGKYKKRIWVPNCMVGDKDYGTVIKSYSLGGSE